MKISLTDEGILVGNWRGEKFRAKPHEITEVRVMADKAIPESMSARLKHYLGGVASKNKLRAIIVWAGENAVTLDGYYDDGFERAVEWLDRNGWDMQTAVTTAERTPLVRVTVNRPDAR
ncbi:MAG: hypothetical protein ACK4MZ_08355 [Thermomonas haemolytica]